MCVGQGLGLIFNCACLSPNHNIAPFFGYLVASFCALALLRCYFSISIIENIMFPNTYGEYTKDNPGIQIILNNFYNMYGGTFLPHPRFPAGDTCLFTSFVYIFGKVLKRTWLRHGRVRPNTSSHPAWTTNIPPTIRRFSFGNDHL